MANHDDEHDGEKDYKVGYGKPPKHTQFRPGQSGNPEGRPKDSRNVKDVLKEVANEPILVKENGESIIVSKKEALVRTLFAKALNGDMRATRELFRVWSQYSGLFRR